MNMIDLNINYLFMYYCSLMYPLSIQNDDVQIDDVGYYYLLAYLHTYILI